MRLRDLEEAVMKLMDQKSSYAKQTDLSRRLH